MWPSPQSTRVSQDVVSTPYTLQPWEKSLADEFGVVADYFDKIADLEVVSRVEPGYLRKLLPLEAPPKGEPWEAIRADLEKHIMPGITHW